MNKKLEKELTDFIGKTIKEDFKFEKNVLLTQNIISTGTFGLIRADKDGEVRESEFYEALDGLVKICLEKDRELFAKVLEKAHRDHCKKVDSSVQGEVHAVCCCGFCQAITKIKSDLPPSWAWEKPL